MNKSNHHRIQHGKDGPTSLKFLSILLTLFAHSVAGLNDRSPPRIWGSRQRFGVSSQTSQTSLLEGVEANCESAPGYEIPDVAQILEKATSKLRRDKPSKQDHDVSHPPRIIIIGGPASGKGTQCEHIASRYGVLHLSTGDMLREAVKNGSAVGRIAKQHMDRGELVPDEIIIQIVSARMELDDCQERGWLLDGFPRTEAQAEHLARMGIEAEVAVLLNVSDSELIDRVIGRRVDRVTGKIYHLKFRPPPPELVDRLDQRSDDTAEKAKRRLEQFHENLSQIRTILDDSIVEIDGSGDPNLIAQHITRVIDKRLRQRVQSHSL